MAVSTISELPINNGVRWCNSVIGRSMMRLPPVDALPPAILNSKILCGNDLGQLANVTALPHIDPAFEDERLKHIVQYFSLNPIDMEMEIHRYAKELLVDNKVDAAWQVLLSA